MKGRNAGLLGGALVGFLWMWLGFGEMLFIGLCAFIGWLVAGVFEGQVDLYKLFDSFRRK
ncbi:MAG: hypothetical protein GX537_10075 [Actinobacteria bacterium]|nr:hypothetical protein [Actinomycetota bacterium]